MLQRLQAFLNEEMTMKIGNCLSFTPLGAVLALACMILAGGAAAKAIPYDFQLSQVSSQCTGPARFKVRMSFKPAPDATKYTVASGNACYLGNALCGTGGGCTVTCSGPGPCEFELDQCQQGHGTPWVGMSVPSRYYWRKNKLIQAPSPPKYCP
jgi:hypothetical protein